MTAEAKLERDKNDILQDRVVAYLPAASGVEGDAFTEICFESWLSLCNVATWLDMAEDQSKAKPYRLCS